MSVQGPGSNPSARDVQKKLAKERRDRRLRRAMITMSWTTPVLAFGGFFTIWHQLSTTLTPYSSKSTAFTGTTTGATTRTVSSNSPIVLAEGATGQNVEILQYALSQLGYFHHALTTYYGPVTASAVKAFQQANNLPATGQLDEQTLNALQAVLNQVSGRGENDGGGYGDDGDGSGDDGGYSGSYGGTYGGPSGSYAGTYGSSGGSSSGSYFGSGSSGSSGGATVSPPSTQPSVSSSASMP